jgi:hypothetical protein
MNKLTTINKEKKKEQKEKKISNIRILCLKILLISGYKYKGVYKPLLAEGLLRSALLVTMLYLDK